MSHTIFEMMNQFFGDLLTASMLEPFSKESSTLKTGDSKNGSKSISVLSTLNGENSTNVEPNESKSIEGSAGQGDSGFKSNEGIRGP